MVAIVTKPEIFDWRKSRRPTGASGDTRALGFTLIEPLVFFPDNTDGVDVSWCGRTVQKFLDGLLDQTKGRHVPMVHSKAAFGNAERILESVPRSEGK